MDGDSFAVEASGLFRRYGRRWALVDVSLQLPAGAVLMVTGRNGSGKSTLLRVLATAIRADRGSARVLGYDCRNERDEVRRRVAFLSHYLHLYEALSPRENLGIAARFLDRDAPADSMAGTGAPADSIAGTGAGGLDALLEQVGLADRADDPVATFSAGMRRRLALARTLLQDAPVVLLDEPYSQLDPPGFRLIDGLLRRLKEQGRTVVMATHLLDRGPGVCDRAVVLEQGRLVWSGAPDSIPETGG